MVLYIFDLGYFIAPILTFIYYLLFKKVLLDLKVTINSVEGDLSLEFKEVLRGVQYGKSLTESLDDMQENIPSEAINNIILTITQANMFGNSIIDTLYNQIDFLREKKTMEIKAEISKMPIKISIISVLFFVPLILLIILAPVLLSYIS